VWHKGTTGRENHMEKRGALCKNHKKRTCAAIKWNDQIEIM